MDFEFPLPLDRQLGFGLYSAFMAVSRVYKPWLDKLGLTYPQYLVMLVLWESSPVHMSDLGQRLYLDSGTLTPLLKRLEAAGFIQRDRDPDDERRIIIALTPAGTSLKLAAGKVPLALAAQFDGDPEALVAVRDAVREVASGLASRIDRFSSDR